MKNKPWIWIYSSIVFMCTVIMTAIGYCYIQFPDKYTVLPGETVTLGDWVSVSGNISVEKTKNQYNAPLCLFGVVPVKDVSVVVSDRSIVTVCGTPFGIKLYTNGVLVVGMSDVMTAAGGFNPAATAGIRVGDTIVSIDGKSVTSNEDVAACINACNGRAVCVRIRRDGIEFNASFVPIKPSGMDGYRAGLWVRDSTAGIGTLTFIDNNTGVFAGLGHPVCDADTGQVMSISSGEIVPASIVDVKPGAKGTPGELHGVFEAGTIGQLILNQQNGLYGTVTTTVSSDMILPIAMKQDVKAGKAELYTTIDGTTPQLYSIEIKQVRYNVANDTRSMIISITDDRLLSQTGGIVQGMSGSPIIQNGKLVGAVTHV